MEHIATGVGEIPLKQICRRQAHVFDPMTTLQTALIEFNQGGIDAALVAEDANFPLGIVTLSNLLDGITLQNADLKDPVIAFMTAAPVSLPADAPAHRAKVLMTRSRIDHLVLTDNDGHYFNLLSHNDFPGHREGGADELISGINKAITISELAVSANDVRKRGAELFAGGMGVETLCQWISGLNDLIGMRAIEITADDFDLPPVSWAWMTFGSEGRLEQTFSTDQDNGLIFLPDKTEDTETLREQFLGFAKAVNHALDRCGFELCKGNIMAGNPDWCLSVEEWQNKFSQWMTTPDPEALLNATIFFDFRPLYGQDDLVDDLRNWLLPQPAKHSRFLHGMAAQALGCGPALGFLGKFSYDSNKDFPKTIDLKKNGSRPFVDAGRIWALQHQSWATNTADRFRQVASMIKRSSTDTAATIEAFDLIQRIRIQQQLASNEAEGANRVKPDELNDLQKLMLKEAFKQAKLLQLRLRQEHNL